MTRTTRALSRSITLLIVFAALAPTALAAEKPRTEGKLEAAKEEAGARGEPKASVSTPAGILRIVEPELVAATFGQPIRFELTLDRNVEGATVALEIPKRWQGRTVSGLAPSKAARTTRSAAGVRLANRGGGTSLELEGARAGARMTFEIVDTGILAGTYRLPVSWTDSGGTRDLGSLELRLYAPVRESESPPNPWRDMRVPLNATNDAFTQSETWITVAPNDPQRVLIGANSNSSGQPYNAWLSTNGGTSFTALAVPTTGDAPGTATDESLSLCCDPFAMADDAGNIWYGGLSLRSGTNRSRITMTRIPAGQSAFVAKTVGLPERTNAGTQDKPMGAIDNSPTSPTYGRLYVVWDEPGTKVVLSACDTRPGGGALDAARCDNADNWTAPISITPANGSFIYPEVAVAPDGKVHTIWWDFSATNAIRGASCTTNCTSAASWSAPQTIATLDTTGGAPVPFACPILAQPGGRAAPATAMDIDRSSAASKGTVYVTWSDLRAGSGTTRCSDNAPPALTHLRFDSYVAAANGALPGGAQPSAAVGVSIVKDAEGAADADDWFPAVAVDQSTGKAYVDVYSTRLDSSRKTMQVFARQVTPAEQLGPLGQVSTAASDYSFVTPCCQFTNEYGDYNGIDAAGGNAYVVWSDKSATDGEAFFDKVAPAAPGPEPSITFGTPSAGDAGDGDGFFETGETLTATVPLGNNGSATASSVTGTLSSTSPHVEILDATQPYGNIPANGNANQAAPYRIRLRDTLPCGAIVRLLLTINYTGGSAANQYVLLTGVNGPGGAIPDANATGFSSSVALPAGTKPGDVDVGVTAAHSFVEDLTFTLTGPDGTSVMLFQRFGGSGDDLIDTVFDDEATTSIAAATAPFTGRFKPSPGSLSAFNGRSPVGTWTLKVTDSAAEDTGVLQTWALCLNQAPNAVITGPPSASAGPVSFDAGGSSDPDGTIAKYQWDGDGNGTFEADTGTNPKFTATLPAGTRTVSVRVTDNGGETAQASTTVQVAGVTPTPTPTPTPTVTPPPNPIIALGVASVKANRKGVFALRLTGCANCRVSLTVTSTKKLLVKGKRKKVRLGTARFNFPANGRATARIKLSKANLALLKKLKRIPSTVSMTVTNSPGTSKRFTGKVTIRR